MLKKVRNLRALKPGQWARTTIPDLECWKKGDGMYKALAGERVDICLMPIYRPRYDSEHAFHWSYHVAYRNPGSFWPNHSLPEKGGWISPWDFGLEEGTRFFWVEEEWREHEKGNGTYLYEPACDDPELCPGPDCSLYHCDRCSEYRMPWSDDDGNLVCPYCEVPGLVILDDRQLDRLEEVREFARQMGMSEQLERQLSFLGSRESWGGKSQCVLGYDFAPHSFSFAHYRLPELASDGKRTFYMNGGLIYQGPDAPADGSFPSLTVSLASGTGWFCHT